MRMQILSYKCRSDGVSLLLTSPAFACVHFPSTT
jgi:hypothetical protein